MEDALKTPAVERLLRLIRFRNEHPAFEGDLRVLDSAEDEINLERRHGAASAWLHVDLAARRATIMYAAGNEETRRYIVA